MKIENSSARLRTSPHRHRRFEKLVLDGLQVKDMSTRVVRIRYVPACMCVQQYDLIAHCFHVLLRCAVLCTKQERRSRDGGCCASTVVSTQDRTTAATGCRCHCSASHYTDGCNVHCECALREIAFAFPARCRGCTDAGRRCGGHATTSTDCGDWYVPARRTTAQSNGSSERVALCVVLCCVVIRTKGRAPTAAAANQITGRDCVIRFRCSCQRTGCGSVCCADRLPNCTSTKNRSSD